MEATTPVGNASVRLLQKFLTTILGIPTPSHHRHAIPRDSALTDIDLFGIDFSNTEDLSAVLTAAELHDFSTRDETTLLPLETTAPWRAVDAQEKLMPEQFTQIAADTNRASKPPVKNLAVEAAARQSIAVQEAGDQGAHTPESTVLTDTFVVPSWGVGSVAVTRVGDPAGDPLLMLAGIGGHSGLFFGHREGQTYRGLAHYLAQHGFCCYLIDLDNKGIAPHLRQSVCESQTTQADDALFAGCKGEGVQDALRAALNDSVFSDDGSKADTPTQAGVVTKPAAIQGTQTTQATQTTQVTQTGLFKWVTQDLPAAVAWVAEQHPAQRQRWLGHGAAGLVWWALWARYPEFRSQCYAIMQVATARTTHLTKYKGAADNATVGDKKDQSNLKAVARKTRFNWWLAQQGFAQALIGPKGEVPLRELGLAGNNESQSVFNQWLAWCDGDDWIDPVDGFAYGEVIRRAQRQPFCSCWVADQGVSATETGVRALMGTLRLQNPRLFVIKEPFDNTTLLTSPQAVENHFPTMLNWLNLGRRRGHSSGPIQVSGAAQKAGDKPAGLTLGA